MIIDAETRLGFHDEQIAAKVMDGDAILINLSNGLYYRMGGAGGWIWSLIEGRHSVGEIAGIVSSHFGVPFDAVFSDLQRLASELLGEQLIRIVDGEAVARDGGSQTPDRPAGYDAPILEKYSDMADMFALDPPLPGLADVPAHEPPDRLKS
jgi:hypothetical protein